MHNQATQRCSNYGSIAIIYLVFVALLLSYVTPGFGQSKLYFQHRDKPHRQKNISPKKEYTLQTTDTTFYRYRIISLSNDILKINSSSMEDTLGIPVMNIEWIEREKDFAAFEVIGMLGVICLTITPVIWAVEGNEEALGMLEASGGLLAVSVPIILLKEIGRKKDMRKKWKINRG